MDRVCKSFCTGVEVKKNIDSILTSRTSFCTSIHVYICHIDNQAIICLRCVFCLWSLEQHYSANEGVHDTCDNNPKWAQQLKAFLGIPSILSLGLCGLLQSIPTVLGWRLGYTLDKSPLYRWATYTEANGHLHSHRPPTKFTLHTYLWSSDAFKFDDCKMSLVVAHWAITILWTS